MSKKLNVKDDQGKSILGDDEDEIEEGGRAFDIAGTAPHDVIVSHLGVMQIALFDTNRDLVDEEERNVKETE